MQWILNFSWIYGSERYNNAATRYWNNKCSCWMMACHMLHVYCVTFWRISHMTAWINASSSCSPFGSFTQWRPRHLPCLSGQHNDQLQPQYRQTVTYLHTVGSLLIAKQSRLSLQCCCVDSHIKILHLLALYQRHCSIQTVTTVQTHSDVSTL